jgi:hypothetical protein
LCAGNLRYRKGGFDTTHATITLPTAAGGGAALQGCCRKWPSSRQERVNSRLEAYSGSRHVPSLATCWLWWQQEHPAESGAVHTCASWQACQRVNYVMQRFVPGRCVSYVICFVPGRCQLRHMLCTRQMYSDARYTI